MQDCLVDNLTKQINRFPFTEMTDKPLDYKHVSSYDFENSTTFNVIVKVNDDCLVKCWRPKCFKRFCITSVTALHYGKNKFGFLVEMPQNPSTIIRTFPKVTFLDFFIYIFSAFGLWFGLSVLSLDPMKMNRNLIRKWTSRTRVRPSQFSFRRTVH
jgi:hypothetical protein